MGELSVLNLGELSKPATTLVEKISNAIGLVYEPYHIVRVAKAEAKGQLLRAKGDIETSELQRRAAQRFVNEEVQKQQNMEEIIAKSLPFLENHSKPEELDNDWIMNFFEKCRVISDEEMQKIWAAILSGEANKRNSFSKRTVSIMSDMDYSDAIMFTRLCCYTVDFFGLRPLIFNLQDKIYAKNDVDFRSVSHLESLGLVHFGGSSGYVKYGLPRVVPVRYFDSSIVLTILDDGVEAISSGKVRFTKAGRELFSICGCSEVTGFKAYAAKHWRDMYGQKVLKVKVVNNK